jgi:hypothetical protein
MEYGGITPLGLPADWLALVDESVAVADGAVVGSGGRRSKIGLLGRALAQLPNAVVVASLGREATKTASRDIDATLDSARARLETAGRS